MSFAKKLVVKVTGDLASPGSIIIIVDKIAERQTYVLA